MVRGGFLDRIISRGVIGGRPGPKQPVAIHIREGKEWADGVD